LIGEIQAFPGRRSQQLEQQRLLPISLQLLVDLVAQGFAQHQAVPITEKSILMDIPGKQFFVHSDKKEGTESHAAGRHRIQHLHAVMGGRRQGTGRSRQYLRKRFCPFVPGEVDVEAIERPQLGEDPGERLIHIRGIVPVRRRVNGRGDSEGNGQMGLSEGAEGIGQGAIPALLRKALHIVDQRRETAPQQTQLHAIDRERLELFRHGVVGIGRPGFQTTQLRQPSPLLLAAGNPKCQHRQSPEVRARFNPGAVGRQAAIPRGGNHVQHGRSMQPASLEPSQVKQRLHGRFL